MTPPQSPGRVPGGAALPWLLLEQQVERPPCITVKKPRTLRDHG